VLDQCKPAGGIPLSGTPVRYFHCIPKKIIRHASAGLLRQVGFVPIYLPDPLTTFWKWNGRRLKI
jgi:hypothetical protein